MIDANQGQPLPENEDEDTTVRLLRMAGVRPEVSAERAARVRHAVHLHWQAVTHRRTVRRRTLVTTALLATAAALVLVVRLRAPHVELSPSGAPVATVERIEGYTRLQPSNSNASSVLAKVSSGDTVRTGEWVVTDAAARAALRLGDGTSVRLDTGSRARLLSSTVIELTDGALYLDTGPAEARSAEAGRLRPGSGEPRRNEAKSGLEVRTPLGTAYDIGTQFEIRLQNSSLRLRVRTGIVELRRGDQSIPARPGTELTLAAGGVVSGTISAHGPDWEWAASVAPAFEIEGRPLAAFLEHLSREHGWTLHYADPRLAREASGIILHGSVTGLNPREALAVAVTTSGLVHRFRDGELFVFRTAQGG